MVGKDWNVENTPLAMAIPGTPLYEYSQQIDNNYDMLYLCGSHLGIKTNISNNNAKQSVNGNTNTVYIDPLNSLRFVLNKLQKDRIKLNYNFYVFTGSSVGVVPIVKKGIYIGRIEKLGTVKTKII